MADPLALQSIVVNDSQAQRSMVTEVLLTFNNELPSLSADAIELVQDGVGPIDVIVEDTGDGMTWKLTFTGPRVIGGSLPDGTYHLTILGDQVTDVNGQHIADGDQTATFHRIFGDVDGDGDFDNLDFNQFRDPFGSAEGDPNYDPMWDFNTDSQLDALDLVELRNRLNLTLADLSPQPALEPQIVVNQGQQQRSRLTQLTVSFTEAVVLTPESFLLTPNDDPTNPIQLIVNQSPDGRTIDISFTGPRTTAGSLDDGVYTFEVDRTRIFRASDGATPVGLDSYFRTIHRLFGDIDGDADVDRLDYNSARPAAGTNLGETGYVNAFDYNDDGTIDTVDLQEIRDRLNQILTL